MKKFLTLLCLTAGLLRAQSGTIDLRSHGSLEIYLEEGWKVNTSEFGDRVIVNIDPKNEDINANMVLTITFPEKDEFPTKPKLKTQVAASGKQYEEGSVEGKSVPRELLNTRAGYGFYCSYTDPALVGKPPQKGNFKGISLGLFRVAPDILIEFSISADGFRDKPYQELLGAIEGMDYKARRPAR